MGGIRMREIKFRQYVWDSDNKGGVGRMVGWEEMLAEEVESLSATFRFEFSNTSPLMQYTGLKDKNGREIYEGDILQEDITGEGKNDGTVLDVPVGMKWNCSCCDPVYGWGFSDRFFIHHVVVIGNIYENPELLDPCKP